MNRLAGLNRRIRHVLAGPVRATARWTEHRRMFEQAYLLVQVFYVMTGMRLYGEARPKYLLEGSADKYDFLWPVVWMDYVPLSLAGDMLASFAIISGFLGIFFWRYLIVRLAVALSLLQFAAFANSFGSISHGHHEWFWVSACFCFLPGGRREMLAARRPDRMAFLYTFGFAQALILFFYSLSGFYKVKSATIALVTGQYGGFMPDAMAQTLARRQLETRSNPLWDDIIINYPLLGWPAFLGLYFVELVAVAIIFRPALHRLWGFILIAFHFGTLVFMDIAFTFHVAINGLLFLLSPFAPRSTDWRVMSASIPILGWFPRRFLGWTATPASALTRPLETQSPDTHQA